MRRFVPSFRWFFFPGLFCISVFLTLQIHKETGRFNWHSEIYADGAGYYAYLPVTLLYRFNYDKVPPGINDSTSSGFIDHAKKKFIDKYTCGVALMVSPFFAATVMVSAMAGIPLDGGFSIPFHRMADIAGVFYLLLGLFFTGEVLKRYVHPFTRYMVLLFIYAGTNLYFYTLRQPLMSHVYSFCLISLYLFLLHLYLERSSLRLFILVAFSAALVMLVRPVNGIVLLLLLFWNTGSFRSAAERLRSLFTIRNIIAFMIVLFVTLLPQMLYWQYMFGTPLHYAYGSETFTNWDTPPLAEIWFAPLNGLFLYNPVWLVCIAGVIMMVIRKEKNGILLLLFFLLISYIISAWHSWFFGCGYGHRAFIDFLPLFAIPFALITERVLRIRTRIPAVLMILLLTAMSYYNIRLIYSYSGCFFGSVWDWNRFARELRMAGFCKKQSPVFVFTNDFETGAISPGEHITDREARSYNYSVLFGDWRWTGCDKSFYFYEFAEPFPTHADIRVFIKAPDGNARGAEFYCKIEREGKVLWENSGVIKLTGSPAGRWCEAKHTFVFPAGMPWDAEISFQLRNPGAALFYVDDQKIVFY
jgi:hypothetical protein